MFIVLDVNSMGSSVGATCSEPGLVADEIHFALKGAVGISMRVEL